MQESLAGHASPFQPPVRGGVGRPKVRVVLEPGHAPAFVERHRADGPPPELHLGDPVDHPVEAATGFHEMSQSGNGRHPNRPVLTIVPGGLRAAAGPTSPIEIGSGQWDQAEAVDQKPSGGRLLESWLRLSTRR